MTRSEFKKVAKWIVEIENDDGGRYRWEVTGDVELEKACEKYKDRLSDVSISTNNTQEVLDYYKSLRM